jgi:transposase-like protein
MVRRRRNSTREFKAEAVGQIAAEGKSLAEASRELSLDERLLRSWNMALATQGEQVFPREGNVTAGDYVHRLLDRISKEVGGVPKTMIRNIADLERNQTDFNIPRGLKDELAFEADVVILAIGENAPSPKTDDARKRLADSLRDLLDQIGRHGHPKVFVRSAFWPDAKKDRLLKQACDDAGGVFVDFGTIAADPKNSARSERRIEDVDFD